MTLQGQQETCEYLVGQFLTSDRQKHSLAVADRAAELSESLGQDRSYMHIAGLLHDIGYGHPWLPTSHHAFNGWDFLTEHPTLSRWAPDVLWHSTAVWEAAARGIDFPDVPPPPWPRRAILWIADFTTGPQGQPVSLSERVHDIRSRYPRKSPVVKALKASMPTLCEAAECCSVEFEESDRVLRGRPRRTPLWA